MTCRFCGRSSEQIARQREEQHHDFCDKRSWYEPHVLRGETYGTGGPLAIPGRIVHALRTWPRFYEEIVTGRKSFEIRQDDRDYRQEDVLFLREWDPDDQTYSGRACYRLVTYILRDPTFVKEGTCVMSLSQESWLPEDRV